MSRPLLYVAYPMRLDLSAANAIQTYQTVKELMKLIPDMKLVVPRWLLEKSAFADLGAFHLPRPAVNKLSRLVAWSGWSYIERTLYSMMLVVLLVALRVTGRGYKTIYVRDTVCAAWLALFRPLHGARLIYEVHDLEASHPSKASRWPSSFWKRFLPWLDHVSLGHADAVVSLTVTFKEWLVASGVKAESRIHVVPDAFSPPDSPYPSQTTARRALGLPEDAYIVGYAGLTFAYRRLDLLVSAFAPLAKGNPAAILLLVGGRPAEVAELRALARAEGIGSGQVALTGQVDHKNVQLYLAASDVLVIPDTVTQMTASPLKLFEYMAVGRAIVCKAMPALREILDKNSALFFPEGDVTALSATLSELMDQPKFRASLASEAKNHAQQYTYQARAEKIAQVVASCK